MRGGFVIDELAQRWSRAPRAPRDGSEWRAIEDALGTALPGDYKAFVDAFGHGSLGLLRVLSPFAEERSWQLVPVAMRIASRMRSREPFVSCAREGGWLPWGLAGATVLAWRTTGAPDAWRVTIGPVGASPANWTLQDATMTELVRRLLDGALALEDAAVAGAAYRAPASSVAEALAVDVDRAIALAGRLGADAPCAWGGDPGDNLASGDLGQPAWSPDGELLAIPHGAAVSVVSPSLTEIARLDQHSDTVVAAAFSPDGEVLATVGHERVLCLLTKLGDVLASSPLASRPRAVRFADGETLVVVEEARVATYDGFTAALLREFPIDGAVVGAVNARGDRVAWASKTTLAVTSTVDGGSKAVERFDLPALAFGGDEDLFIATSDGALAASHPDRLGEARDLPRVMEGVCAIDAGASTLAAGGGAAISIVSKAGPATGPWSAARGALVIPMPSPPLERLALDPRAARIIGTAGGSCDVIVWDAATGRELARTGTRPRAIASVAIRGSLLALGGLAGGLVVLDLASGSLRPLGVPDVPVTALAFDAAGARLASAWLRKIVVADVAAGAEKHVWKGHADTITSLVFDGDDVVSTACEDDRTLRRFSCTTGKAVDKSKKRKELEGVVVALDPGAKTIAFVDGAEMLALVATLGGKPRTLGLKGAMRALALGASRVAAWVDDGPLLLLDRASGAELARAEVPPRTAVVPDFAAHSMLGQRLAFDPTERVVALAALDGVRLYRVEDAKLELVARLQLAEDLRSGFAIAPDGTIDLVGDEAVAATLPIARVGSVVVPFERVAHRLRRRGLLRAAIVEEGS